MGGQADCSSLAAVEINSLGSKGMRAAIRAIAGDVLVFRFFDPDDWFAATIVKFEIARISHL